MSSNQKEWQTKTSSGEANADARVTKTSYPFLVHSQESLGQQTPPDIDNQRLARQKRRRTSPEDHAVLEAEYERNPKPDKAARLEIVKKVALGEKEVQIWFQNRRQVTRRKSRPLFPHEVLANLQSASQGSEHAPSSGNPVIESSQQMLSSSQSSIINCPFQSSVDVGISSKALKVPGVQEQIRSGQGSSSKVGTSLVLSGSELGEESSARTQRVTFNDANYEIRAVRNGGLSRSLSQTLPKKRRPESFGNRRCASFIIHNDGDHAGYPSATALAPRDMEQGEGIIETTKSSHSLRRTSSLVRLSMSLDGKAQVTTSAGTTPSPPRSQTVPYVDLARRPDAGLRRSFSATEPGEKDSPNSLPNPIIRHQATGRSRDARTWEFYCDKDARDALTEQAEREESGSATAAIALIKSNSNTSKAITVKSNKRNAHTQKREAAKRLKANGQTMQKPKLERSQSSFAKMQTATKLSPSTEAKAGKAHRKAGSQSAVFEIYEGDSDKENWVPGTQHRSPARHRPTGSTHSRRILRESLHHSSGLGALMSQERNVSSGLSSLKSTSSSASEEKENGAPEINHEISAFTGNTMAPREADDLDCVQNLLSLSQATWK